MKKSTFHVRKMDCSSEENLIKMKLQGLPSIRQLSFDLHQRSIDVFHEGNNRAIADALDSLDLGSELKSVSDVEVLTPQPSNANAQKRVLWAVLIINIVLFIAEMTFGVISKSMGLIADSLDMLADSLVYALSLYAVGGSLIRKKKIAKVAGYFQVTLAVIGLAEVIRRFFLADTPPDFMTMIILSIVALVGNSICLFLLAKSQSREAHMQASMIFTSNDITINVGVIIAGVLVMVLGSPLPDLIVGSLVFVLVMRGAKRILAVSK